MSWNNWETTKCVWFNKADGCNEFHVDIILEIVW